MLIKNIWSELSKKHNVPIKVMGSNAIPSFEFCSKHVEKKLTLLKKCLKIKF